MARAVRFSVYSGYGPPVLSIGLFARPDDGRTFLAVADCRDAGRRNARRDQDILYCLGAAFAKRKVILARTALVAMPLDSDRDVRITAQPIGLARKDLLSF